MFAHAPSNLQKAVVTESSFLATETVADVVQAFKPSQRRSWVDLEAISTAQHALEVLLAKGMLSAPVYRLKDGSKTYISIIRVLDLLQMLDNTADTHVLQTPLEHVIGSENLPFATVHPGDTLAHVAALFCESGIHHVLVLEECIMLSPMDIVRHLQKNNHRLGRILDLSLSELTQRSRVRRHLPGTWQMTPITQRETALTAFVMMANANLSVLPIVDDHDFLVCGLSPENLCGLDCERLDILQRPVLMYLKEVQGELDVPFMCHDQFTLSQIMTAFVLQNTDHLWWRDNEGHVKGVVVLTDLLGALY